MQIITCVRCLQPFEATPQRVLRERWVVGPVSQIPPGATQVQKGERPGLYAYWSEGKIWKWVLPGCCEECLKQPSWDQEESSA